MFRATKSTNSHYFAFQSFKINVAIEDLSYYSSSVVGMVGSRALPWLRIVAFGLNVTGIPAQKN